MSAVGEAVGLLERNVNSSSVDRQQRAYEITAPARGCRRRGGGAAPRRQLEDEVDPALPSLDAYVPRRSPRVPRRINHRRRDPRRG